jgi:hypothetical protein
MKHAILLEGELIDEHTIHIEKALTGVSGKLKILVEFPGKPAQPSDGDNFEKYFKDIQVDLKGFKFNSEEANER